MPGELEEAPAAAAPGDLRAVDATPRRFTWHQLSRLNERHNAHVAVRGKVYDVSGFLSRHPGGAEQLLMGAGRDVTQLFESYHSFHIYNVLEKFYVGDLVDNEMPTFPPPGEFYKTLKSRVARYFKDNNVDPKIDYWMFFRYFVFLLVANLCWVGWMYFHSRLVMGIALSLGWGFFSAMVAMTCTHDASHFAITHKPWVWKMVGSVHDFYHGASMLCWVYQHVLGHHPYTNIDGADPDIVTARDDVPDVRRIKWNQHWMPRYFYQHIYMPMLYCVLGVKTRLQDFYILFLLKNSTIRVNPPTWSQWAIFLGGKLSHCTIRFFIPLMLVPWPYVLLYNIIAEICGSYWLALIFQTSHVISEVEWPTPDKDNVVHQDWAELQVATTQDYATDSWFWSVFTGALNHQVAHHLFPGVIQSHYVKLTPIVRQTCLEFGVPYHYVGTTKEAFDCHVAHLKRLGQLPAREPAKDD